MTKTIDYETVQKIRYIADDGTEFEKEIDCKAHERKLSEEVKKIKWNRIFGEGREDFITWWTEGRNECWYNVTISSEEDLVDLLTMINNDRITAPFVGDKFTNEVLYTIGKGEKFTMLLYDDPENNYMNRFNVGEIKTKEQYERYLKMIDNLESLAADFRNNLKYEPKEENENK